MEKIYSENDIDALFAEQKLNWTAYKEMRQRLHALNERKANDDVLTSTEWEAIGPLTKQISFIREQVAGGNPCLKECIDFASVDIPPHAWVAANMERIALINRPKDELCMEDESDLRTLTQNVRNWADKARPLLMPDIPDPYATIRLMTQKSR